MANLYLHCSMRYSNAGTGREHGESRLVRYADDFVIMARSVGPRITLGGKNVEDGLA